MDGQQKQVREKVKSSMLKCGKRTYFFDVQVASNKRRYLKITESQVPQEGEEKGKRSSFVLFPEDAQNFKIRLDEIVGCLTQTA